MKKGIIIVIEGADGTGKATTTKLVHQLLVENKTLNGKWLTASFPNYDSYYGQQIRHYLDGDSAPEQVRVPEDLRLDPYLASLAYAADRYWTYTHTMRPELQQGNSYILDRYYISNMAHQGCRLNSPEATEDYVERLLNLELGYFRLPEPDIVVVLDLPEPVRQARTERRREEVISAGVPTTGQVGLVDLHEQNAEHMNRAAAEYRRLASRYDWPIVSSVQGDSVLTSLEVAQQVFQIIQTKLQLFNNQVEYIAGS